MTLEESLICFAYVGRMAWPMGGKEVHMDREIQGGLHELLTANEVAERMGVTAATVYRWGATGQIPHVKVGRTVRYDAAALANLEVETTPGGYSRLHVLKRPHEAVSGSMLADFVAAVANGITTGELDEDGARKLLAFIAENA